MPPDNKNKNKGSARDLQSKREALIRLIWYLTAGSLALLITLAVLGQYFGFLGFLGLDWMVTKRGGVFADCSKPENAKFTQCQPKQSSADRDWNQVKGGGRSVPFTLHDN